MSGTTLALIILFIYVVLFAGVVYYFGKNVVDETGWFNQQPYKPTPKAKQAPKRVYEPLTPKCERKTGLPIKRKVK